MKIPGLWSSNQDLISDPFKPLRREMEDMFRAFDRNAPSRKHRSGRASDRCRGNQGRF